MKHLAILFVLTVAALAQTPDPHSIPAVDAQLGPCSATFTVTGTDSKPVYSAKIDVRVQYGHFHRMDLEVSTNVDGKARFTGLPTKTRGGLYYQASEGDRTANAFQDPSSNCNIDLPVVLRKSTEQPQP